MAGMIHGMATSSNKIPSFQFFLFLSPLRYLKFSFLSSLRYSTFSIRYSIFPFPNSGGFPPVLEANSNIVITACGATEGASRADEYMPDVFLNIEY